MKKTFILALYLISLFSYSQISIEGTNSVAYTVISNGQKIEYLHIGTDNEAKPTILFLQGSLPVPLIIDFGNFKHVNLPFQTENILKDYHIVIISMPETPLVVSASQLNKQYCYITDSTRQDSYSPTYISANHLENYVNRTQEVITDLEKNQKWVLPGQIHLIGHSQGAKIATVVASQTPQIASLSLLGFNPYGRYDEFLRRLRKKRDMAAITEAEYIAQRDGLYSRWADIVQNPHTYENKTWLSFSVDYTAYFHTINCPIFIGYGSHDPIAANCDLLPLDLIQMNKQNYTLRCYSNQDHNFFNIKDGKPDYENGNNWTGVIEEITTWIANH